MMIRCNAGQMLTHLVDCAVAQLWIDRPELGTVRHIQKLAAARGVSLDGAMSELAIRMKYVRFCRDLLERDVRMRDKFLSECIAVNMIVEENDMFGEQVRAIVAEHLPALFTLGEDDTGGETSDDREQAKKGTR